jgi:hypothetical protein
MAGTTDDLRVFIDNPTSRDLLGFESVARSVAHVLITSREPTTVGLHGPWGSGKSSLLSMVRSELGGDGVHIVDVNPWEFDDHEDVKGALIGLVLESFSDLVKENTTLAAKVKGLAKRISWGRATRAIARGALTMQWDPDALIDAFTPVPEAGRPGTMSGFRDEFGDLVSDLGVERVVVLVDDLDRCLPSAVLASLEAIKLFLSVPKMAFVLAADQDMVREAIAAGLGEQHRSSVFARDYLDKIVQVPVTLPYPTLDDTEAYVALLLCEQADMGDGDFAKLISYAGSRRAGGDAPYLGGERPVAIPDEHLFLAERCVRGLSGVDAVNPRRVKRFMNAYAVRRHAVAELDISLQPDVLIKLLVLEHRFLELFKQIATSSTADRATLLIGLEEWAAGPPDAAAPDGLSADARPLLAADPHLSELELDAYFALARRLSNTRVSVTASPEVAAAVQGLLSTRPNARERAVAQVVDLDTSEQQQVLDAILAAVRTAPDPNEALLATIALAAALEPYVDQIVPVIRSRRDVLRPGHAVLMLEVPAIGALAAELQADTSVSEMTRNVLAQPAGGT